MKDSTQEIRKRVAECIRQFLSGHVSCDHLIYEFKHSDDEDVREIIRLVEEATADIDKYERADRRESHFKESMEALIRKLEET